MICTFVINISANSRHKKQGVDMTKKLNIIYTRVSTDLQAKEGFSLGAQYKYLTEYCENKNISNVYHIEDSGISVHKCVRLPE